MKKYTKYLILSFIMVLCIMVITVSLSYSLFSYSKKGNIKNQIVTGIYNSCEYENGTEWTFNYTGSSQEFTVPCDGEYKIELWGAQGGNIYGTAYNYDNSIRNELINYYGGLGAYTKGNVNLRSLKKIYIYVGQHPSDNISLMSGKIEGGYNGGANIIGSQEIYGSPGGGATDIRLVKGNWDDYSSLKSRIMVAAGGGGANFRNQGYGEGNGGDGGSLIGITGYESLVAGSYFRPDFLPGYSLGTGGTQTSGGSTIFYRLDGTVENAYPNNGTFGGANFSAYTADFGQTGAGGGYYSGGSSSHGGAGGGSSFISGHNGCDAISINSTASNIIHTNQSNHYSGYVFTDTKMIAGNEKMPTHNGTGTMTGNTGNGYAKITLVESKERYRETLLNGTNPVLDDNLIPIKIASDGSVTKANIYDKWYSYENKEWANAVILKDGSKVYQNDETIPESNIESYFVWIPRYKYKIFDTGSYTGLTSIASKEQVIEVVFENKDVTPSNGTTVGSYLTHPAFTSFDSNGMWVGKFETGYDGATSTTAAQVNSVATDKIIIKPNVYSWRNITVGNMFKNSYEYQRELDSHMMKNTEWGAVSYLQHSQYGSETSVRINNNNALITGYAGVEEPTLGYNGGISIEGNRVDSTSLGVDGTYTINYLNSNSKVASTTGNYTGIYDMSGGSWEYVMGYTTGATVGKDLSEITSLYPNFFSDSTYTKYWDKYTSTTLTNYNNRILGDATGEMGPFGEETDPDGGNRRKSSWYKNLANFLNSSTPWINRSGAYSNGIGSGIFSFYNATGATSTFIGFRVILTPQ